MYYAGIGSRITPPETLGLIEDIAKKLSIKGLILRSGGAWGADTAFERSVKSPALKEIYYAKHVNDDNFSLLAMEEARKYHKAWEKLSPFAKKLHARSVFLVLGKNLKILSSL